MCVCCVRMSNHSGCKPLQTLCVTAGQPLGCLGGLQSLCTRAAWQCSHPRWLQVLLWGIVMNSSLTVHVWWAPCQTVSCKGTGGVGHWPKACLAGSLRQGCDRLDCHGDTVPPHQTCFRSMLWPDSSCPNFSWLKITSLGLVCKSEEGHEWRCLWKTALWHHLPSPLMNGWN